MRNGTSCVSDGTMWLVSRFAQHEVDEALGKVRVACLVLPETSERLSHGGPSFFIRDKKCFVMFLNDHHEDGRLAIWCAAPDGVQAEMVETDPERFFRPPMSVIAAGLALNCQESTRPSSARSVVKPSFPSRLRRW